MDHDIERQRAGDLGVPKKIQKMGNIFYGLLASLDAALTAGDVAGVEAVLQRNIYGEATTSGAAELAGYLVAESRRLAGRPAAELMAGGLGVGAHA